MNIIKVSDLHSIDQAAKDFISFFDGPSKFAFYGEMGSGKTTFIKAICKHLKVRDVVTSPTFAIVNEYSTFENDKIFHFDFYRIESLSEVYDLGYEEYFRQENYCFIEWPELIETLLPPETIRISIVVDENGNRIISKKEKLKI